MATEKRLIDANGSYTLNANDNTNHSLCFGGGIISVMDEWGHCICEFGAEDAPTVDAVEVVRCKDCKMWEPGDSMMGDSIDDMQRVGGCPISRFRRLENDFCSYGERRTDG